MLPLRIFPFSISRRVFVVAAASLAGLVFAGVFVYQVQAWTSVRVHSTSVIRSVSSGTVYLSAAGQAEAAATVVAATKEMPMREIHIANNGLVLLRGVTVIAKSRGAMRVSMAWDSADFTWTITTDSGTRFLTSGGQKAKSENIEVGDVVTITGTLVSGGADFIVAADYVRE